MIIAATVFAGVQTGATARPLPQLLIILDSSSSMEDLLGNELKYKLVRRAMSKALPAYGDKLQTGLIVFGHNQKNSCKDIARVAPLKTLQPKSFSRVINNIKPKGKSPIGAALVDAVNMTIDSKNPLHILLIADGSDNCRNNVCATAELVANHSSQTRVHVIGIGKTGSVNRLACIAQATNGSFTPIASENQLTVALNGVLQTVINNQATITSSMGEDQQRMAALAMPPLPARKPPHKVAIYKKPQSRPATDVFEEEPPSIPETALVPTTQAIKEATREIVKETAPEVVKEPAAPEVLKKPVAKIAVQKAAKPMVTASTPTPFTEPFRQENSAKFTQKFTQNYAPAIDARPLAPQPLPVMPQKKPPTARTEVKQPPPTTFLGNKPSIEITLPQTSAQVKLGALIKEQGKQIQNGLVWRIYNTKKDDQGRYKLVKSLKSPRFDGTLPLGVYLVNLSWGRSHLTEKMDILSSKPFTRNFILNAGGLRLSARHANGSTLPSRQVVYQIYTDERDQFGKRRLILDNAKPGTTIRLNAGIYHIKSLYGTANGIIDTDITVEAAKLTDVVINHTASKVTFKLVNQPGGEALAGAIWQITSPDGKLIKEAGGALPTLILAAGDYTINAQYTGRTFARKVTIEPGAPVHVEIVIQ